MAKFRKKPVIIEAEQWFEGREVPGVIDAHKIKHTGEIVREPDYINIMNSMRAMDTERVCRSVPVKAIKTLEGWHEVQPGDWVITGITGEKYPCKPDIFEATYEPVNELEIRETE